MGEFGKKAVTPPGGLWEAVTHLFTLIHRDGTEEDGTYREMKDMVLQDGDRIVVE